MCADCKNLLILFAISRSAFFGQDSKMFKEKSMLRRGKKEKLSFGVICYFRDVVQASFGYEILIL